MKKQIEFNFDLWGQEGISVESAIREKIITLHQHPSLLTRFYGLTESLNLFNTHKQYLTMYQEVKPREIWINEYKAGLNYITFNTKEAAKFAATNTPAIRQVKFIEVIED